MPERLARPARLLPTLAGDGLAELRDRWRSQALTLVGIAWGTIAVVLLLSLGSGFNAFLDLSFEKTGKRWILAQHEYTSAELGGRRPGRAVVFEVEDLELLRAGVPSAALVAAEAQRLVPVESARRTRATVVSAASAELEPIQNHKLARGRWFARSDERAGRAVAVLGAELAPVFFGDEDPLGRRIQIAGTPFEIIGVLARRGFHLVSMMDQLDFMAFVPLGVGLRALSRGERLDHFYLEPRRLDDEPAIRRETFVALARRHHLAPDDDEAVTFLSIPEVSAPTRRILFALHVLLGVVGTVTLAMAGVGVANLMLAIASERQVELAVRRACGARRGDLALQLLVETLAVALTGGALGAIAGLAIIAALQIAPLPPDFPPPRLLPSVVATSLLVLVSVGLVAGVAPARRAARVDPSAALRAT